MMKEIPIFEEIIWKECNEKKPVFDEYDIDWDLFCAYYHSRNNGNALIDLYEVIREKNIESVVSCMRENGITEFTISTQSTALMKMLVGLKKLGFKMDGITEVNSRCKDRNTGEYERIPAIKMVWVGTEQGAVD